MQKTISNTRLILFKYKLSWKMHLDQKGWRSGQPLPTAHCGPEGYAIEPVSRHLCLSFFRMKLENRIYRDFCSFQPTNWIPVLNSLATNSTLILEKQKVTFCPASNMIKNFIHDSQRKHVTLWYKTKITRSLWLGLASAEENLEYFL